MFLMSSKQIIVQTADGRQPLAEGIIYGHEHLWLDLSTPRDPAGKLDKYELIVEEMHELKALGVAAVIEQTCLGMGRDIRVLRSIQRATGLQVIPSSGYYYHTFHPQAIQGAPVEEVMRTLEHELTAGADGLDVYPLVLGEIGGSGPPLHRDEETVFRAVSLLAEKYPVVVTTHAHLGGGGRDELDLLLAGGMRPERILLGHQDLCPDLEAVLDLARRGAYIGFDTIGKTKYAPDERRVAFIQAFLTAGLADRLILSCDISRNAYLRQSGGQGYAYLLQTFVPLLEQAGITRTVIDQLLCENPRRFLAAASREEEHADA
jgi:phosphotriesterase-related protein